VHSEATTYGKQVAIMMQAKQTGGKSEHIIMRLALMGLLFMLNAFNIVNLKELNPPLGYAVSLFIGMITGYLILPAARFWIILLIAAILAVSHFMLVPYCGH
jgi:hypothetical protein